MTDKPPVCLSCVVMLELDPKKKLAVCPKCETVEPWVASWATYDPQARMLELGITDDSADWDHMEDDIRHHGYGYAGPGFPGNPFNLHPLGEEPWDEEDDER